MQSRPGPRPGVWRPGATARTILRLMRAFIPRNPHPRMPIVAIGVLALAAAFACAAAAPATHHRATRRAASRPAQATRPAPSEAPVELVESVPLETSLGNPELRRAKDVWPALIRNATTSIDLEQFYLSTMPNEPLEPVLAALVEAARR